MDTGNSRRGKVKGQARRFWSYVAGRDYKDADQQEADNTLGKVAIENPGFDAFADAHDGTLILRSRMR